MLNVRIFLFLEWDTVESDVEDILHVVLGIGWYLIERQSLLNE